MAAAAPDTGPGISANENPVALPPELVALIRRIEIRARRLTSTLLSGDYRSVFHGAGLEFSDAREYVPGDDVRLIDWNVTARMGTPWVKQYVEERELNVVCAVDLSASQLVAQPPFGRLGVAAEVCALLSFAAAYSSDLTGLLTFSDRVERFVPARAATAPRGALPRPSAPGDGRCRGLRLPRTRLAAALDRLPHLRPAR